jgi:hypothetical protein
VVAVVTAVVRVEKVGQRGGEHREASGDRQTPGGRHPAHGAGEQDRQEQNGRAAKDGADNGAVLGAV